MADTTTSQSDRTETSQSASPAWSVGVGLMTHVGMIRAENQDAFSWREPEDPEVLARCGRLMVVCDGMGGHYGGSIASRTTVDAVVDAYYAEADDGRAPSDRLLHAVREANRVVRDLGRERPELRQMGTTCVAVALVGGKVLMAHIGDSRIYRLRDGAIRALTRDHTYVNDLVEMGALEPEEAENHPQRHVITRCIGMGDSIQVDLLQGDARLGDAYLLCSDGLYQHIGDDEMVRTVDAHEPQAAAQRLIDRANECGGEDNITVGILHLEREAASPELPSTGDKPEASPAPAEPASASEETGQHPVPRRGSSQRLLAAVLIAECVAVAFLLALIRYA